MAQQAHLALDRPALAPVVTRSLTGAHCRPSRSRVTQECDTGGRRLLVICSLAKKAPDDTLTLTRRDIGGADLDCKTNEVHERRQ